MRRALSSIFRFKGRIHTGPKMGMGAFSMLHANTANSDDCFVMQSWYFELLPRVRANCTIRLGNDPSPWRMGEDWTA